MDPITLAKLWMVVKPVKRIKAWRKRKKGQPVDEVAEDFNSPREDVSMDSLKGALKSKLIWFGLAQAAYGIIQLWATGTLTVESVGPVLSGAITVWLRAVTTGSLADKAK